MVDSADNSEDQEARAALASLAGDPAPFVKCSCGCYHPKSKDTIGRTEVRFACPHHVHTLDGTMITFTNPPNDGAVISV